MGDSVCVYKQERTAFQKEQESGPVTNFRKSDMGSFNFNSQRALISLVRLDTWCLN